MSQMFKGFNNLSQRDKIKIHPKKSKKGAKEGGKTGHLLTIVVAPVGRIPYSFGSSSSKKAILAKPGATRKAVLEVAPIAAQVSYQNVPRLNKEDKCPILKNDSHVNTPSREYRNYICLRQQHLKMKPSEVCFRGHTR